MQGSVSNARRARVVGLGLLLGLAGAVPPAAGQTSETYRGRLSVVPVDPITAITTTGQGEVRATLEGDELRVTAHFEGLSSAATAAHLHRGPRAVPGPVAFTLDVPWTDAGELADRRTLNEAQIGDLRAGRFYLQIHTESNPAGEVRGWLFPED